MNMGQLWKSEEDIVKEQNIRKEEERLRVVKKARENNLIQDTEVLAEMVMTSMMESMTLAEEVEMLKSEIKELQSGRQEK